MKRFLSTRVAKSNSPGELLLANLADHLERGEMPPDEIIKSFSRAVDAMQEESDSELRRWKFCKELGLLKRERDRYVSDDAARIFWLLVINDGLSKTEAYERAGEAVGISARQVQSHVKKFTDAEQWARGLIALHKETGE